MVKGILYIHKLPINRKAADTCIIIYNAVINACAESGDKNVALNLFDAMSLSRVAPDAATVSFVMRALVTVSQVDPALKHDLFSSGFDLLDQVEHGTYEYLKNESYGIHLDLQHGLQDQKVSIISIDSNIPKSGLQLASGVQKRMERLQLRPQHAIVTANMPALSQRSADRTWTIGWKRY